MVDIQSREMAQATYGIQFAVAPSTEQYISSFSILHACHVPHLLEPLVDGLQVVHSLDSPPEQHLLSCSNLHACLVSRTSLPITPRTSFSSQGGWEAAHHPLRGHVGFLLLGLTRGTRMQTQYGSKGGKVTIRHPPSRKPVWRSPQRRKPASTRALTTMSASAPRSWMPDYVSTKQALQILQTLSKETSQAISMIFDVSMICFGT